MATCVHRFLSAHDGAIENRQAVARAEGGEHFAGAPSGQVVARERFMLPSARGAATPRLDRP